MDSKDCIIELIRLTKKKSEALLYLLNLLSDDRFQEKVGYRRLYFQKKFKIEQAILKVDIEFLAIYNCLLKNEQVDSINQVSMKKLQNLNELQLIIKDVRGLERKIEESEEGMVTGEENAKISFDEKPSKHTGPRAIEAYKKLKK